MGQNWQKLPFLFIIRISATHQITQFFSQFGIRSRNREKEENKYDISGHLFWSHFYRIRGGYGCFATHQAIQQKSAVSLLLMHYSYGMSTKMCVVSGFLVTFTELFRAQLRVPQRMYLRNSDELQ